jgi:hypothetical protein
VSIKGTPEIIWNSPYLFSSTLLASYDVRAASVYDTLRERREAMTELCQLPEKLFYNVGFKPDC